MPAYDWEKIRQEYIADPAMSYRKLAVKYCVSYNVLTRHAIREGWYNQRNQMANKRAAEFEEKMVASAASDAENILKARSVLTMRALEMAATATRPSDIINLTNALQILARMTGVQSDLDTAEQKARIASIEARSQTQEEEEGAGVIVIVGKDEDPEDE